MQPAGSGPSSTASQPVAGVTTLSSSSASLADPAACQDEECGPLQTVLATTKDGQCVQLEVRRILNPKHATVTPKPPQVSANQ